MEEGIAEHFEKVAQSHWEFRNPEEKCWWAWAAGLIDGEGCISIKRRKTKEGWRCDTLTVTLGMTDKKAIQRLKEITQVGSIRFLPAKPEKGWRAQYIWSCASGKAASVLRLCLPWLITKKEQAFIALAFRELQERTHQGGGGRKGGSLPRSASENAKRQALAEALRLLHNTRGNKKADLNVS